MTQHKLHCCKRKKSCIFILFCLRWKIIASLLRCLLQQNVQFPVDNDTLIWNCLIPKGNSSFEYKCECLKLNRTDFKLYENVHIILRPMFGNFNSTALEAGISPCSVANMFHRHMLASPPYMHITYRRHHTFFFQIWQLCGVGLTTLLISSVRGSALHSIIRRNIIFEICLFRILIVEYS